MPTTHNYTVIYSHRMPLMLGKN